MPPSHFLFLHIPKTAGTMFTQVLRQNFGNSLCSDHLLYANIAYEPWQIEDAFRILPHACFSSHALRATSLPKGTKYSPVAFAFVRTPVEHAISGYFDLRNRVAGPQHATTKMRLSELTDLWERSGYGRENAYSFSQLQWLYPDVDKPFDKITSDLKSGRLLLFPTSRMNDCLVCLEKAFPSSFYDCSYASRQNVSTKDHSLDETDLNAVKRLPWIANDMRLFNASKACLDRFIQALFENTPAFVAARRKFEERCDLNRTRSTISLPESRPASLPSRIRHAAKIILNR